MTADDDDAGAVAELRHLARHGRDVAADCLKLKITN